MNFPLIGLEHYQIKIWLVIFSLYTEKYLTLPYE